MKTKEDGFFSNEQNVIFFAICLFVFYSSTYHIYNSIFDSFIIQIIVLGSSVFLLFLNFLINDKKKEFTNLEILWILFLGVFLFSFRHFSKPVIADFIIFAFSIFFMVLSKYGLFSFKNVLIFIKYISIFYACGVFFQYLAPELYVRIILPIFNENGQNSIIMLMKKKSYSGFTHQTAFTAGYLVNGFGVVITEAIINRKVKVVDIISSAFLFSALLLTGKRAHLFFGLLSIATVGLYYSIITNRTKIFLRHIVIIFVASISFFGILHFFSYDDMTIRIIRTIRNFSNGLDISNGRSSLHQAALEIFLENPILGIGWRQFMENSLGILNTLNTYHPHNIYLQLLAETGIIGFTLFSVPMVYALVKSFQTLASMTNKNDKTVDPDKTILLFAIFLQIFYILYGLTGNGLTDKSFLTIYFFGCSIINAKLYSINMSKYNII